MMEFPSQGSQRLGISIPRVLAGLGCPFWDSWKGWGSWQDWGVHPGVMAGLGWTLEGLGFLEGLGWTLKR